MATKARVSQAKKTPPPQVISEVHLIPLACITVNAQVRTEFNDDSIRELAIDIEENGLLQPVLVNPIGDEKYSLVCGERRLRAIRLLGQKSIPALITKVDESKTALMQLAENIQREDMSLHDTAQALRKLYDAGGSMEHVAGLVRKSKAWVCKRIATTYTEYSKIARSLIIDNVTDDMELVGCVNTAERELGKDQAFTLATKIRTGEIDRHSARIWLAMAKADKKSGNDSHAKHEGNQIDTSNQAEIIEGIREAERKLFELDAEPYEFDLTRTNNAAAEPWSEYTNEATGHRWAGWLAAKGVQ